LRGPTISKDIPVSGGTADRALESFLEPDVIITRVVGDDINHDLNAGFVESIHHDIKVFKSTDFWVDISVVGNIIYSSAYLLEPYVRYSQPPSLRAEG
jgi:hypothetical protein